MPRPRPEPDEILIRVRAAGVCGSDIHIFDDAIKTPIHTPVIVGHECAGDVIEVGSQVKDFAVGERVSIESTKVCCEQCELCLAGNYNLCKQRRLFGYWYDGCFAEQIAVPAKRAYRLPPHIAYEEGALCEPLACAVHAVNELTPVAPGEFVVVIGPGTIGLLTQIVAQAEGAHVAVISTPSSSPRLRMAERLGAALTLELEKDDVPARILEATGGKGADVVFECAGSPKAVDLGFDLVRKGGRFTLEGLFGQFIPMDFDKVAFKEIRVVGALGQKRSAWNISMQYLAERRVNVAPLISRQVPLEDWEKAFDWTRGTAGREHIKVLLIP
ncbi:MAG: alcohol dehydrogenase catalytic domain-containing protein [Pirellulales bacterium]|nr:alcohol dehydrogenase catalytic domain-containing protein [Pirellulales bacterium]